MHVAIDARLYSSKYTGIGRYTHEISTRLFTLHPTWRFTLFLSPEEYTSFQPPSDNITALPAPENIYSLAEQTSFLWKLSSVNADITWFPHFNVPLLYKKKFIVTVHDLTLSKFPGKKMNSWIHRTLYFSVLRHALRSSVHVLTVSHHTKNDIISEENILPHKISVAGNAVGKEFLHFSSSAQQKIHLCKKYKITSPYFLYTGQHRQHKNLLGMVQGFHLFLQKNPSNSAQLIITGKKNPLYPEFWEYVKHHNLTQYVRLVGQVPEQELKDLYFHAKAYIFPSFYEGFGIPPLEAMALGTPVIASESSSIPEVCGDACLYFPPENPQALANQITSLVHDSKQEHDLIHKGYQRIKKFSWDTSAQKISKILQQE